MKTLITAAILSLFSVTAHASLFSCEDVVRYTLQSELYNRGLEDVIVKVEEAPSKYSTLRLFTVMTKKPQALDEAFVGIPYSAFWLVVVRDTATSAGCIGEAVLHDITAL